MDNVLCVQSWPSEPGQFQRPPGAPSISGLASFAESSSPLTPLAFRVRLATTTRRQCITASQRGLTTLSYCSHLSFEHETSFNLLSYVRLSLICTEVASTSQGTTSLPRDCDDKDNCKSPQEGRVVKVGARPFIHCSRTL
jgi:hypothetical protein